MRWSPASTRASHRGWRDSAEHAADTRAQHSRPTQRQLFAESLVIASLGFPERCPDAVAAQPHSTCSTWCVAATPRCRTLREAASMLYDLAVAVPNVLPECRESPDGAGRRRVTAPRSPSTPPSSPNCTGTTNPRPCRRWTCSMPPRTRTARPSPARSWRTCCRDNVELEVGGQPIDRAELEAMLDNMEREATERALSDRTRRSTQPTSRRRPRRAIEAEVRSRGPGRIPIRERHLLVPLRRVGLPGARLPERPLPRRRRPAVRGRPRALPAVPAANTTAWWCRPGGASSNSARGVPPDQPPRGRQRHRPRRGDRLPRRQARRVRAARPLLHATQQDRS